MVMKFESKCGDCGVSAVSTEYDLQTVDSNRWSPDTIAKCGGSWSTLSRSRDSRTFGTHVVEAEASAPGAGGPELTPHGRLIHHRNRHLTFLVQAAEE